MGGSCAGYNGNRKQEASNLLLYAFNGKIKTMCSQKYVRNGSTVCGIATHVHASVYMYLADIFVYIQIKGYIKLKYCDVLEKLFS